MTAFGSPPSDGPLKGLSTSQYSRLSELLDASLEIAADARDEWLAAIDRSDPALVRLLSDLLRSQDAGEVQGFLESPIPVPADLTSLMQTTPGLIGKQFGPYRVLSLLGHGGMGSVWLAERVDGLFTRRVALKLVHPALMGGVMTERFTREREILASLNHPNIARLSDAGFSQDGQPFLALEYIAGTPFTAYCDHHGLSVRNRLDLFRQVLSAVQHAHANLVIHRDLKPSNILVTEDGQVHLLDFGIAKLLTGAEAKETELTQFGGRALTPDYAAPEQIAGAPITIGADVYSLGVMLYELMSGERPYRLDRDSRGALEEAILKTEPLPPSRLELSETAARARGTTAKKLARDLKGDLDTIVLKSLKKLPAERYATVSAFGEDIGCFLRGDVVRAQRDSVAYRALKFTRRHRLAIVAAGVLILTLAFGLAATSYEAEVASIERDAALQAQLRSLTQTAAARLGNADVPGALGIILEVLPHRGAARAYTPEALSVFQQARAADAQILAITGHTDQLRSVAFSPDGRRILTASWDKTARIWDAATGQEITQLIGHTDRVWFAAFSPDGRRVITASHDKTARIWDAATGRQILVLNGHQDRVTCAAFSPDGRRVVTSSYDKTARIWDAATGQQILVLSGHADLVMYAAFSPDGRRVVTASHDRTARIWDAATGRQIRLLSGHTDWLTTASFSPDGLQVVTASYDKTAGIWDAHTGRQIRLLSGHTDRLWFAAFSPDGRQIVTGSYDKTARIWNAATGRELKRLSGHTREVVGAAFSPDGRRLATASYDKTARIWDASIGGEIMVLNGHTEPVACASFSRDGLHIVTGSYDKTARIWDAATGRELMRLSGHTDQVVSAAFSPDGRRVVTASPDKTARIWDVATGRELKRLNGHTDSVVGAAFSPDGRHVVTASLDKTARVWDAATGSEIMRLSGHTDMVETAEFSRDGRRIVTASHDKTARVWDAATGAQLMRFSGHTERVESAAFSPDGRRIVTASADKTASIWDVASGRQLVVLSGHADLVEIAAFSPDGRRVVTASDDKTARIWDAATGLELRVLSGHTDRLWYAAFSPDGRRVVTTSDDRTVRIWDARTAPLDVQIGWSAAAQFDPLPSAQRFQLGLPAADVRRSQEKAVAGGYRSARVDLGMLLSQPSAAMLDVPRAVLLYEQAWSDGVKVAAFELGSLYEQGVSRAGNHGGFLSAPDSTRAWLWYRMAADAGEPNALARYAERDESAAVSENRIEKRNLYLLEAFKHYTAAAERARSEDWPDNAWRPWRYRRASLARVLAREGMMQQVAAAYEDVLRRQAPPTMWQRVAGIFATKD